MKRLEQYSVEQLGQTERETSIDTQTEVELICGGVGFDDSLFDADQWLKDARDRQMNKVNK